MGIKFLFEAEPMKKIRVVSFIQCTPWLLYMFDILLLSIKVREPELLTRISIRDNIFGKH